MDNLKVAPEEVVALPFRNGKKVRVTHHMYDAIRLLREHLKGVARRGETITYGEASEVTNDAYIPQGLGPLLDLLSIDCQRRDEPSLAALVVRADDGEVGDSFVGDPQAARDDCYTFWQGT